MNEVAMKPQKPRAQEPDGLFKTPLERFIDMRHPLVGLAECIDWDGLDGEVAGCFGDVGRPAVPTRFMLGMLVLKAMNNLSDEALFDRWTCDPYFQHFTGELYFQHRVPHERSRLSHWRNRLGTDILDRLLRESLNVAQDTGALARCDMELVTVDTTVQEKSVRFPAGAALLYSALTKLGTEARLSGIKLRQSYVRVGKRAQIMAGRYAHARQYKRMRKQLKFLKTRLGRVIRDVERNIDGNPGKQAAFASSLRKARIIGGQALKPHLKAELKRRSAIEPVIGHAKADHRMGRNHLKGRSGDRFSVKIAAIGLNFRRSLK